jgi:phosphoglycolate phosphatase-like HAD superfamily hydrolase
MTVFRPGAGMRLGVEAPKGLGDEARLGNEALPPVARTLIAASIAGIVFDLDNTLYTNPSYAKFQEDVLVGRLGSALGMSAEAAAEMMARLRAERRAAGLPPTSLGNLSASLGFDIATSVRWREESIEPAAWLDRDPRLGETLSYLADRFALAVVSNNPRSVVEKSLQALGVGDYFKVVAEIQTRYRALRVRSSIFAAASGSLSIDR